MVEEICSTFTGGDAAFAVMVQAIQNLSSSGITPTLLDVRDSVRSGESGGRTGPWKQTALRILDEVVDGPLGRVFCSERDAGDVETLLDGHTVLELDGLTRQHAALATNLLLRQLHNHLQASVDRERLKLLVCLEEAHELAPRRDGARESIIETVIRQGRESGLGLLLATQSPVTLSQVALSNCYAVASLNLRSRNDIAAAAQNLLLDSSGAELLATIPVGQAVCRLSDRWPRPVHIEIPKIEIEKGRITDAAVLTSARSTTTRIADSSHSALRGTNGALAPFKVDISPVPMVGRGVSESGTPSSETPQCDRALGEPGVQLLLKDIAAHPFSPVSERYERLGLSRRKGNAARRTAEQTGLVDAVALSTERGSIVLLALCLPAITWLRQHKVQIAPVNGSLVHGYWQSWVGAILESAGYEVSMEHVLGTHRIDVHAISPHGRVLVEIETGTRTWRQKLEMLERQESFRTAILWLSEANAIPDVSGTRTDVVRPSRFRDWVGLG
ncbi:MAG: hypothetical protein AAFZ67_08545 [Planctomycetota bacterium]